MLFKRFSITLVIFLSVSFSIVDVLAKKLYLGGDSIGIKLNYNAVLITGTYNININNQVYNPKDNGLKEGCMITKVNDVKIKNINELMNEIEKNAKKLKSIVLTIDDQKNIYTKELLLQNIDNKFSTGLYVCDGLTGIGTMTYYDPETNRFGALGHIMTNSKLVISNNYINGNVYLSNITSIVKSKNGNPGEKIADISNVKIGEIDHNNHYGIFGLYTDDKISDKQLIETASINEIKKGKAYFYTVTQNNKIDKYDIEITALKKQKKSDIKGISFKVTDKRILNDINGIVQGMSGSPIVQNGKLIGCITHVDINNPCLGYGLYIDWMLENDK